MLSGESSLAQMADRSAFSSTVRVSFWFFMGVDQDVGRIAGSYYYQPGAWKHSRCAAAGGVNRNALFPSPGCFFLRGCRAGKENRRPLLLVSWICTMIASLLPQRPAAFHELLASWIFMAFLAAWQ